LRKATYKIVAENGKVGTTSRVDGSTARVEVDRKTSSTSSGVGT
jgi:hypothetical protein